MRIKALNELSMSIEMQFAYATGCNKVRTLQLTALTIHLVQYNFTALELAVPPTDFDAAKTLKNELVPWMRFFFIKFACIMNNLMSVSCQLHSKRKARLIVLVGLLSNLGVNVAPNELREVFIKWRNCIDCLVAININ